MKRTEPGTLYDSLMPDAFLKMSQQNLSLFPETSTSSGYGNRGLGK